MAELFRHTDEDGDRIVVEDLGETFGDKQVLTVAIGDPTDFHCVVYLDRDAALRLAAALLRHYETSPEVDHG